MLDLTPWGGIIPIINDMWVFLPAAFYFLGRYKGRKQRRLTV